MNHGNWLQIDDVGGMRPRVLSQTLRPDPGLDLVDVNIAYGNPVGLIKRQAGAQSAYGIGRENGPDVIAFEDGASA